jgi:hypothetical protein
VTNLPRRRPDPIPAIHPLPEYLAEGRRRAWYDDMKRVFQVPWMGVVTMAYAHYPNFFETLWQGVRDLCASRPFVEGCLDNRAFVESEVAKLEPPTIGDRLDEMGYAPREIENIKETIEVFSHGNQPYVVLATLARYLLEAGDMLGVARNPEAAPPYAGRHAPGFDVPFVLMEAHHADSPTQGVYEDIKRVLDLPFVNTDYRALARWPSYWAMAWGDLRQVAGTPAHEGICLAVHDRCVELASLTLPNPGGLTAKMLRGAAEKDAPLEEVRDLCRLFQWLLPGLVTNVAYLRAQFTTGKSPRQDKPRFS